MKRDPIGLQNLLEFLWNFIRDIARDNIGEKYYRCLLYTSPSPRD